MPPEQGKRCAHRAGLGGRGKHRAERDVVRAGGDGALGELGLVVARGAEKATGQPRTRGGEVAVVPTEMHAVRADGERELEVVVHDERSYNFV